MFSTLAVHNKTGSLGLLAIRSRRPLDFDSRVGQLVQLGLLAKAFASEGKLKQHQQSSGGDIHVWPIHFL